MRNKEKKVAHLYRSTREKKKKKKVGFDIPPPSIGFVVVTLLLEELNRTGTLLVNPTTATPTESSRGRGCSFLRKKKVYLGD